MIRTLEDADDLMHFGPSSTSQEGEYGESDLHHEHRGDGLCAAPSCLRREIADADRGPFRTGVKTYLHGGNLKPHPSFRYMKRPVEKDLLSLSAFAWQQCVCHIVA